MSNTKKLIAVVGATGHQGGAVVRALQASGQFKVRALTRNPAKHPQLADEVVLADLNRPETLKAAFAGAHGVFLVTNAWEPGTDERKQALAAVHAAKDAGVQHFIWSTLPNVETISRGKIDVPHFTDKAKSRAHREGGRIRAPHIRDRAVLSIKICSAQWLRRSKRMGPRVGRCRSIRSGASFTWATSPNSAASWSVHSRSRNSRGTANICRWSATS